MNALICIAILNVLNLLRWRGRNSLRQWLELTQDLLRQVEIRQYGLSGPNDPRVQVFQDLLERGRLHPGAAKSLLTWIRRLDQDDAARRRLAYGSTFRLALSACLGLIASLYLERQWMLRLVDNPPAALLILGESLMILLWLQRLKPHPLAASRELQADFAVAWLGQSRDGPWHEPWLSLQNESQTLGRDRTEEKQQLLEDWLLAGCRDQEKRMIWAEELFGLVELAGSVYFLGTACALPLLKLWGA